ncbi:protein argonaute-2-like [Sitodiplosis mosellana]|uniref:protein argonaute-2-like n=1 Tax=Sitodiplosis mosellana TaxID=263140 RepID=UPI0024438C65|nr:protein argonaute-2-like [Sitodiplosis mosellana]
MGRKSKKNDKNISKESKPTPKAMDSSATASHGSGQSQQPIRPTPQQGEAPMAASRAVENLQPRQVDEWKSSQRSEQWPQLERSQGSRSEMPGDRQPQAQQQHQRYEQHRPPHQQQGARQQGRKPQQSQPQKGQGSQNQGQLPRPKEPQRQEGAWSLPPRNQRPQRGSTQPIQSKKPQAASSTAKTQQKRREPLTMEDVKKQGAEELQIEYKGHGTRGQKLGKIETNYVRLSINRIVENIYHYDVSFEPERPKKFLAKAFKEFVKINYPGQNVFVAFDGAKNAYASQQLEITDLQQNVTIIHPDTSRELNFRVTIQEAKNSQIPFEQVFRNYTNPEVDPKRALQGLEVILKAAFHEERVNRGLIGGRSFFVPPDMLATLKGKDLYLGDGCELWLGLFQAVVLGDELFLNVDVSHKAFPKRYNSLFDLLKDLERDLRLRDRIDLNRPLDDKVLRALQRQLSGLDVCYTRPGSGTITIRKFVRVGEKPSNHRFMLGNEQTTVLNYFRERGMKIDYLEMPCLEIGSRDDPIAVPMEFCSISNAQVINKKCTENQTRSIIRHSATSTDERKKRIMDVFNVVNHNNSQAIKNFGVDVGKEFIQVPARKLEAPTIQYKNTTVKPKNGVWNPVNMEFLMSEPTSKTGLEWGILNADNWTERRAILELCDKLHEISKSNGVNLAPQPSYFESLISRGEKYVPDYKLEQRIREQFDLLGNRDEIKILFCIIPDNGQIYGKIKKVAEIDCGVLTQCIKARTVKDRRTDPSTLSNIMLKVNVKLNGTNHKLETCPILTNAKCMFVGADVTHPSPDQKTIPSVVGVAASYDVNAFRYAFYWRLQEPRVEIIKDFKEVISEHLKMYKRTNNMLPDEIFYYRDGVSEGQFDQVMAIETNAMVKACQEIEQGYEKRVKMTVVVVQKRHHTRFFPGKTGVGKDDRKNNNVPAGTIVDTVITRPNENHFYLVSHQSIQGVAKPTKYCILLDEGDHSIDDLQCLTYNLCHLFARCNRTVSYPAPTYCAHLIAFRARKYIESDRFNFNNLDKEWGARALKEKIIKGHPSFFY